MEGRRPEHAVSIHSQPFLGVPFTVKDSVAVKGMLYTAGSKMRKDILADEDAETVSLMRKAGAIPIAITNVPEMLLWWDANNLLYGRTFNPYDKSRVAGGSSGGEAAIISSAGSLMGIATDIGGSIRIPANFCGVFGHKTTPLVVPMGGHYPNPSPKREPLLSFGPICRYATDLKPLVKVLAGENVHLLKLDEKVNISDLTFYYCENYNFDPLCTQVQSEILDAIKKSLDYFKQKGAQIKKIDLEQLKDSFDIWACNMKTDDAYRFSEELSNRNGDINVWLELMKYFFCLSNHTLPALCGAVFDKIKVKREKLQKMRQTGDDLKNHLHQALGNNGVLLFPSHPETAPKYCTTLFKFMNCSFTGIFNVLNVAVTNVPLGLDRNDLPVGFQVVAGTYNDHLTIAVAQEIENEFGGWVSPSKIIC